MIVPTLALALLQSAQFSPDSDTGAYLVQSCRSMVRVADDPKSGDEVEVAKSLECMRFIDGFISGFNFFGPKVCVTGATKGTVARVYVAYMDQNPKYFDRPPSVGLAFALVNAYPCKKK